MAKDEVQKIEAPGVSGKGHIDACPIINDVEIPKVKEDIGEGLNTSHHRIEGVGEYMLVASTLFP